MQPHIGLMEQKSLKNDMKSTTGPHQGPFTTASGLDAALHRPHIGLGANPQGRLRPRSGLNNALSRPHAASLRPRSITGPDAALIRPHIGLEAVAKRPRCGSVLSCRQIASASCLRGSTAGGRGCCQGLHGVPERVAEGGTSRVAGSSPSGHRAPQSAVALNQVRPQRQFRRALPGSSGGLRTGCREG